MTSLFSKTISYNAFRGFRPRPRRLSAIRLMHTELEANQESGYPIGNSFIKVSEEIREAIITKGNALTRPVVALETAIYTHGFPYPDNVALASHLESVVRLNGGIPATIGILDGVARVGLESEELIRLCSSAGKADTMKASTRDLSYICGLGYAGKKLDGGTTVAGTMRLAREAGIQIFATGGLGGVHRGAETSMDVSADLIELQRTPVTVVSSGCKSFLDIPRTLEVLETQGVTVATFADGREGNVDVPAFWTRDSGILSPLTVRDEGEAAAMILARQRMNIGPSIFFANPIPAEHSMPKENMDLFITEAIHDAEQAGVAGHRNTPFVLKRIRELSHGSSVIANRALIESNVIRGTRLAINYQRLQRESQANPAEKTVFPVANLNSPDCTSPSKVGSIFAVSHIPSSELPTSTNVDVLVAGSLAIDLCCDYAPGSRSHTPAVPQASTSNPAAISQSLGGVGQNVATALHYLGTSVRLVSAVGFDPAGSAAIQMLQDRGMETAGVRKLGFDGRTAQYIAVNDTNKQLVLAMADMTILERTVERFETLWQPQVDIAKPKWLVLDANWDATTLQKWLSAGKAVGAKMAFEPVSAAKCRQLFSKTTAPLLALPENVLSLATPNMIELASMHAAARESAFFEREDWWRIIDSMGMSSSGSRDKLVSITNTALVDQGVPQQSIQLLPFIPTILTKLGSQGVLMTQLLRPQDTRLTSPSSSPYILSRSTSENGEVGGVYMRLFPPAAILSTDQMVSVNGAGDTFLGVIIAGLAQRNSKDLTDLIEVAQQASVMTLSSKESVSPEIATLRRAIVRRHNEVNH